MIDISRQAGITTITVAGRFDFRCVSEFQPALRPDDRSWLVDLSRADYVDSAALGMLLLLRERADGDRSRVRIRGAQGQPRDVLLMAKFDRMFAMEPT